MRKDQFTGFRLIGLLPPSNKFFRVVTGCASGRFHANAWLYPTDGYKSLKFQDVLLEHDKTWVELQGAVAIERREEDQTCLELNQIASDGIFWWQLEPNGTVIA
ncbi:MAG: hypothetical protein CBC23_009770 [Rhodospirillaceae bacterium TMED63]|nr:MAG: hypothetical protein CBC23_009770 [Rhodospirillaceae bacterium TMED63]